jgi:tetratricopeptide (TPR) repeat protein
VDQTDKRNAPQDMPAEQGVHVAANDLMVIRQPDPGAEKTYDAQSLERTNTSDQVVVGDIPAQRRGFQPRPTLLAQLNGAGQGMSVPQVLTGIRGVGKTQLAAAYARSRLAAGWRLVAWVNAENAGNLLAGLVAVADAAGLSDGGSDRTTADAGQAVRRWLEADGERCLLVFDDAEDLDVLRPFVPVAGAARVLITTARESVAALGNSVRVDVFSGEEAVALLDGRTGQADEAGAAAVAAELGYLPLALDQAAAVMAGQHTGYGAYLDRLRSPSVQEYLAPAEVQLCPYGVAEALVLSLQTIRESESAGVCTGVVELMAVLSATGVYREFLHTAGQEGALTWHRRRSRVGVALVDQAVLRLAERSLLTFSLDSQRVIAHRLVMRVVRDSLIRQGRLTAVCRAAGSILSAQVAALAGSADGAAVRYICEQITALREHAAEPEATVSDELAKILMPLQYWVLYQLNELGDSAAEAIVVGEPLVADAEQMLGPDHPNTLTARNGLASAYMATGRVAEAIPLLESTLTAWERQLGPGDPSTLATRNNLANAYRTAGRVAEAIPLHELNLAACERLLGTGHPRTMVSRDNLAAACSDAGQAAEAVMLYEQILAVRERQLGVGHPDTLSSRNTLVSAYLATGRQPEAIPFLEQFLAEQEWHLGPDHLETTRSRNNLANAYRNSGHLAEAIPLLEQVLAARERLLGVDHSSTMASRNNLATAYRDTGRLAEAIPLYERTLTSCERLLGADHPHTVTTRHNLDVAYRLTGRIE